MQILLSKARKMSIIRKINQTDRQLLMRILVVNPPNVPFSSQGILIEPIDVLSTASFIAGLGHEVRLLDMDVKQIKGEDIALHVNPKDFDITVIIYDYHIPLHCDGTLDAVKDIAKVCKAAGNRVIVGGKTATYKPEQLLDGSNDIDVLVRNEMEPTLNELLSLNEWTQENLQDIPSLTLLDSDGVLKNTLDTKKKFDLDTLPIPNRNLIDLSDYIDVRTLLSSRGCHQKCDFCHVPGFWGGWRSRDAMNVADEIEMLVNNHNAEKILFLDDNTTVNRKRMLSLCDELIRRGVKTTLGCLGSLSLFDQEMMERMYEAGFRWIHYGVESGDDELLSKIHKRITAEDINRIVEQTRTIGFRVRTSWIIDLPESTEEQIKKTADLILSTRTDEIRLHHLSVRMGSQYFEQYADIPSTQYIHNGGQNQNLSNVEKSYVKDTIEMLVSELEKDGYATVRHPDDFKNIDALREKSPDMKIVSLCPLRYGLAWAA